MSLIVKSLLFLVLVLNLAWAQDPAAIKTEALSHWQKRDEKESLKQAIAKFEQLHKLTPTDNEYLVYLVRGHFLLGDFHTKDKDEKLEHFEKAFGYGDLALSANAEYAARLKKNEDLKYTVKALGVNEVPQMFWTAASIGKYAKTKGIFASLKYKGKILALISRVEELQPDYFYGAVPRYWGSYYAVIPSIAGKDLKKSKKYFEQSLKMAPEYQGTKSIMADTYYVEKEDEKGFQKVLNEVIDDKTYENHPELGPENRLEKIRAKKLLADMKELF